MKSQKIYLSVLLLLSLCFTECKKGEDDPLLSLRTRKARVVGKWKLVSGLKTTVSFPSWTTTTEYTRNEYIQKYTGSNQTEKGDIFYFIEFKKNGEVNESRQLEYNDRHGIVGTWNFTGGIGGKKNKEEILLHDSRVIFPSDIVYNIKELRAKKLVLVRGYQYNANGFNEEFTFEQ
ncbi:hypothetical protein CNR22_10535 [Sphingobacteriaceae bacterium]|nr:hypothetical protein CNR22_10535 [Sphingobacteriaceae bacterium]